MICSISTNRILELSSDLGKLRGFRAHRSEALRTLMYNGIVGLCPSHQAWEQAESEPKRIEGPICVCDGCDKECCVEEAKRTGWTDVARWKDGAKPFLGICPDCIGGEKQDEAKFQLTFPLILPTIQIMSIDTIHTDEAKRELEETIAKLMRGERDPVAAKAARERMDRTREEIRQRIGIVDVAVPFIRELRDR